MPKFHKFLTACYKKENIKLKELGIQTENTLEFKELPINLDHIMFYHPNKKLEYGNPDSDELDDQEIWDYAKFISINLSDGTELTIQCNINEFQEILEND